MGRTILVVDDDHAIATALTDVLTEEGYRARAAFDGATALEEIKRKPPDLVISDVTMPQIDGVTMTKELRAQGLLMPVVLMSALALEAEVPGVAMMAKPFDLDDIIRVIGRLLADRGQ
jgi:DNA-binding response OmpR family regulator